MAKLGYINGTELDAESDITTPITEIIKCHKYCTGVELRDESEVRNALEEYEKLTPAMEEYFNILYLADKETGDVYVGFVVSFKDYGIKVYAATGRTFGRLYLTGFKCFKNTSKTYVVYDNIKDANNFSRYNQLLDEKTSLLEKISEKQKRLRDVEKMISNLRETFTREV